MAALQQRHVLTSMLGSRRLPAPERSGAVVFCSLPHSGASSGAEPLLRRPAPRPMASGGFAARQAQLGAGSGGGSATGGAVCRPPAAFVADGPYVLGEEAQAAEVLKLVGLLPPSVRGKLEQHPELPLLLEVVSHGWWGFEPARTA